MKAKMEMLKAVRVMIRHLKDRGFHPGGKALKIYLQLERDLKRDIAGL